MDKSDDRQLDAYLDRELSRQEQRALAQKALDDPELFDELATAAAVDSAAANEPVGARAHSIGGIWMLIGAAAAVAIIAATVAIDRSSSRPPAPPATARQSTPRAPGPAAAPAPTASRPVILAARLGDLAGQPAPEFRSDAAASRAPKSSGVVVSVENGEVSIDLGSLDGVAKGSEVQVVRAGGSGGVGLTIATVFRERSRGVIAPANAVRVGDRVVVPSHLQLNALVEFVVSRVAAGDVDAARTAARQGVAVSAAASGGASADAMNELAAVLMDDGDYADAETLLRRAQTTATGITAVRVANNLAASAMLRGDVAAAESLYRSALAMAGTAPEYEAARYVVEKSLQDLRTAR
jgi:hypothetical protein